jgi:uncharacterized protein YbaP (TraB family)
MKAVVLAMSCAVLAWGSCAVGQIRETQPLDDNQVEAVVVTARRIGVPVWRVSQGRSTLILVGEIQGVPKDAPWRPAELERTVAQADAVIFPHNVRGSPADIARMLWRMRSFIFLPKGKTLADYVDARTMERLRAVDTSGVGGPSPLNLHPWMVADELMTVAGAGELLGEERVADAVAKAVRKHRKKREVVGVYPASRVLDAYLIGPGAHVPCLKAAIATAEAGREASARRIADWTRSRVPEVIASPAEQAYDLCWPFGAGPARLRADWRAALDRKLAAPGVTVAVLPLLFLAEGGGVLDRLAARGLEISGPRWRAEAVAQ